MNHISKKNIQLLIVDDKLPNLLSLELLLDDMSYDIIKVQSGEEALRACIEYHNIALILMDVRMPGMDGYETATLLKGNNETKDIPIIFITANFPDKDTVLKGYESGAIDYLFKPINPHILKSKVDIFVRLFQQSQELIENQNRLLTKVKELEKLHKILNDKNKNLESISNIDSLTQIFNRRYLDKNLYNEWLRGEREKNPLTLIMIDIDHFKLYNDNFGHNKGDKVLKDVAQSVASTLQRKTDICCRYGGEEFVCILPNTDKAGAIKISKKIKANISSLEILHPTEVGKFLSISLGISSQIPSQKAKWQQLIINADMALYNAKESKRNCLVYYDHASDSFSKPIK